VNVRVSSQPIGQIPPEEVRSHLQRVLASPPFRASKRSYRFLNYVVEAALGGGADNLKERVLAAEVFDRSSSFDAEDTIVRVGAREVRKRLAQYYASTEGMHERLRIELHSGSYVPEFVYAETAAIPTADELIQPPLPNTGLKRLGRFWIPIVSAIVLALAIFLGVVGVRHEKSLSVEFWAPLWLSRQPVLMAVANPLVYHPSSRAVRLNDQRLGPTPVPIQRPLQLPPHDLDGSDMIAVPDQYVGYGDTVAATKISSLLASHSVITHLRPSIKIDFSDFREAPAVLIGAFTNQWTLEFTQKLRFHFAYDAHRAPAILDAANASQSWSIPQKEDNGRSPEDYFMICRLPHSASGKFVVIVAGLTQFGTEAAARFMVDSGRLDEMLQTIGNGWQQRNLQILFHAKVIGNAPSAAELVAWNVS
jgi:hypothetical protein